MTGEALFSVFSLPVRPYGLALALGVLCALLVTRGQQRKRGLAPETAGTLIILAVPVCLVCARVVFLAFRRDLLAEFGWAFAFKGWLGGYAMAGAVLGGVLAAFLCAKATHQRFLAVMDCAAPGAALVLAFARAGEHFTGQGLGAYAEPGALTFFPFFVQNEWGEWYLAVYVLEAVCALCVFAALLFARREAPAGDASLLFLLLIGASQVVLDSMRCDEFLRVGFVRVLQVFAMGMAMTALFAYLRRALRAGLARKWALATTALALACFGVCVWMEFAIDKSPDLSVWLCRAIMSACMLAIVLAALRLRAAKRSKTA